MLRRDYEKAASTRKGFHTLLLLTQAIGGGYKVRPSSLLLSRLGLAKSSLLLPRPTEKAKGSQV